MSYENWKDKIGTFEVMDVRGKKLDFFPALKAKAAALKNGEGLRIIQTFEPVPLYPVLALMGLSLIHIFVYQCGALGVGGATGLKEIRLDHVGVGVLADPCLLYTSINNFSNLSRAVMVKKGRRGIQ